MKSGVKILIAVSVVVLGGGGIYIYIRRLGRPKVVIESEDKIKKTFKLYVNGDLKTLNYGKGEGLNVREFSIEPAYPTTDSEVKKEPKGIWIKNKKGLVVENIN